MNFSTLMPTFLASSSSLIILLEGLSSIIAVSSVESIDEDRDTFNCTGEACGEADSKSS